MTLEIPTSITEYTTTEAALAELRTKYAGVVFDLTTTKGDREARGARKELVSLRTALEAKRKELKAPALAYAEKIDSEAKRIKAAIVEVEVPIDSQIEADEKRRETERAERERLELARVQGIQDKIAAIRAMQAALSFKSTSADCDAAWNVLDDRAITEEEFAEFTQQAATARAETLGALQAAYDIAYAREQEAARMAAEREQLEKEKAEHAEAARLAAAERAKADAAAKAVRDAEDATLRAQRAAHEADMQAQRAEIAKQQAENARVAREQQETADKVRREAEAAERAERQRQDAAKAEQERRDREDAEISAIREREQKRPTDDDLADVIAKHYRISTEAAHRWLAEYGTSLAVAA